MFPHLPLLMGADAHVASRDGAAKQNIPFRLVFREVCVRMIVCNRTFKQPSCASETAAVMANRWQDNSVGSSGIPDVFLFAAIKSAKPFGCIQHNPIDSSPRHLRFDALGVIEAAIFAVRRLPRFAAAEMSGRYRLSIAFMGQQLDKPSFMFDLFIQDACSEIIGSWILSKG